MNKDYEAVIAGIPLLPAAEQAEFFERIRSMQAEATVGALARLKEQVGTADVEQRVSKYVKLRDARAASNKAAEELDGAFKSALSTIEHSLIAAAHEQGVTGFKTEAGTTYLTENMMASIADDNAFYQFVRETGDLEFFERRLKVAHIKEYQDANGGLLPPGLNVFREATMRVRRK